jgi:AraC family transcriptional regulator of adaptative response/methylated-DNA-[protein]-cysteine methyltransferase
LYWAIDSLLHPVGSIPDDSRFDYQRVEAVIQYLRLHAMKRPSLCELSAALHLSEFALRQFLERWAGVSPQRFLQLLTLESAKSQLERSADFLAASHSERPSGPGDLYDLRVKIEAVTSRELKERGQSFVIRYGRHPTPFGACLIGLHERGVCFLEFVTSETSDLLRLDLQKQWPEARFCEDSEKTEKMVNEIFDFGNRRKLSLNLLVKGTYFQVQVWQALLDIPLGQVSCYSAIANRVGRPKAVRAVGSAVGANPIACLIPCHRVLRRDGNLGGYRWGEIRKQACLVWEAAKVDTD